MDRTGVTSVRTAIVDAVVSMTRSPPLNPADVYAPAALDYSTSGQACQHRRRTPRWLIALLCDLQLLPLLTVTRRRFPILMLARMSTAGRASPATGRSVSRQTGPSGTPGGVPNAQPENVARPSLYP